MDAESASQEELCERIRAAVSRASEVELEQCVYALDTRLIESGCFNDGVFAEVLAIVESEDFLSMQGSFHLLRLLEDNWSNLDDRQRATVILKLEAVYDSLSDWMARMLITEILGRLVDGAQAVEALSRLSRSRSPVGRGLVANGLVWVIKRASDPTQRARAFAQLRQLEGDPAEVVAVEVRAAYRRLGLDSKATG